jgi:GNAT superfamily N-acetyltransferase
VHFVAFDAPFVVRRGADEITTARERLDIAAIHAFLTTSYWAAGIPRATVERALEGSLNFGVFRGDAQIAFLRVVTDAATFAYIADVFVLPEHRGTGVARWLVDSALTHPALRGLRRVLLVTRDAHGLYAHAGFSPLKHPERFMEITDPDVYRRTGG